MSTTAVARTGLHLLAPPARLGWADELPLGAPVAWTHRAAVIRWTDGSKRWRLTEGAAHRDEEPRIWRPARDPLDDFNISEDDLFYRRVPVSTGFASGTPNKSILVWPDAGEGFLYGLVRRGIGHSFSATGGSGGLFDDSWEPGGFVPQAFVPLYAVKAQLAGVGYLLCPHWAVAVRPVEVS